ncbi:hypothetical protein ACIQU4_32905 [Streptomyces sp. NPDC090741]|uniref:hypothetical protein n=1 Tax=Streptomyces sp. NPDC090741 TaxID=3365967 RepID=UPI0037F3BC0C
MATLSPVELMLITRPLPRSSAGRRDTRAPYRQLAGKDSLLTAVATESWERIGGQVQALRSDPAAAVRAARRFEDEFLAVVADLVGERNARHCGALLLTSAHGIAGMEVSGHSAQTSGAPPPTSSSTPSSA